MKLEANGYIALVLALLPCTLGDKSCPQGYRVARGVDGLCYRVETEKRGNYKHYQKVCADAGKLLQVSSRGQFMRFAITNLRNDKHNLTSPLLVGMRCKDRGSDCKYPDGTGAKVRFFKPRGGKGECVVLQPPKFRKATFADCDKVHKAAVCVAPMTDSEESKEAKKDVACRSTFQGREYSGGQDWTITGRKCQAWGSQVPHKHKWSDLAGESNYCRNPDGRSTVWCVTVDKNVEWEYCSVPQCTTPDLGCYTDRGKTYRGKMSITASGKTCQPWSKAKNEYLKRHRWLRGQENFCRNPDPEKYAHSRAYCYTGEGGQGYEQCDVARCQPLKMSTTCQSDKRGAGYVGRVSKTRSGYTCQEWVKQYPNSHEYGQDIFFPLGIKEAKNYCRNPSDWGDGLWCYTIGGARWELCDQIPKRC